MKVDRMEEKEVSGQSMPREGSVCVLDPETLTSTVAPDPPVARVPPDGGMQAWLQALGIFFLIFDTWGLLSSYGPFQAFYESNLLSSYSAFQISTIGSLQSFLLMFLGFLSGPIYDAGYSRYLLTAGSLLILAGLVLQAFCTELWQLILAQGLCIGLGCGCISILSVATMSLWFTTRLPVANGLVVSGSGVGGVVFPLVITNLLPSVGFRCTVLACALIVFVTLMISNLVIRDPTTAAPKRRVEGSGGEDVGGRKGKQRGRRKLFDRRSLTDWPYVLYTLACVCVFLGLYTPLFYVQSYATSASGRPGTSGVAQYLVLSMNAASITGRVLPTFFTKMLGSPLMMKLATMIGLSATGFGFIGASSEGAILGVCIAYGFLAGSFFALQPTTFVYLTDDLGVIGTRFGMAYSVMSVGLLVGSPVGGVLQRSFGYAASWIWCGATAGLGAALIAVSASLRSHAFAPVA